MVFVPMGAEADVQLALEKLPGPGVGGPPKKGTNDAVQSTIVPVVKVMEPVGAGMLPWIWAE